MAKFGTPDPDAEPTPPVERFVPKTQAAVTATSSYTPSPSSSSGSITSAEAQIIQAKQQAEIDKILVEAALKKQEENWMKAYWRPAMGWLYMLICFVDFVAFPVIAMFMPTFIKGMQYVAWQSLTLSNGGLIHLAFGAILGITSYTRGQEKIADKK